jgi:hypothetical protein
MDVVCLCLMCRINRQREQETEKNDEYFADAIARETADARKNDEFLEPETTCDAEGSSQLKIKGFKRFKERQKEADEKKKQTLKNIKELEMVAKIEPDVELQTRIYHKVKKLYRGLQHTPYNPENPEGRDLRGLCCVESKEWDLETREQWKVLQYAKKYPFETPY